MTVDANSIPPIHHRSHRIGFGVFAIPDQGRCITVPPSPCRVFVTGGAVRHSAATLNLCQQKRLHFDAAARWTPEPRDEPLLPCIGELPLPCADRKRQPRSHAPSRSGGETSRSPGSAPPKYRRTILPPLAGAGIFRPTRRRDTVLLSQSPQADR